MRIHQYLMGRADIDDLWMQFDSNFDSKVDMQEFADLLLHSQIYFARMKDARITINPTRDSLTDLITELSDRFNVNRDERISKDEFEKYGEYLFEQKNMLVKEIDIDISRCDNFELY